MLEGVRWRYRLAEARALLETERRLLRKGALAEVAALGARLSATAESLSAIPPEAAKAQAALIREIGAAASRNHRLLAAYLEGARDAAKRIKRIEESRAEIGAYRQDGTRLPSPGQAPTRESRA